MPLQHEKVIRLRAYRQRDARAITELFHETVHTINRRDYNEAQVQAWAPLPIDYARWRARLQRTRPLVAEFAGEISGFIRLANPGVLQAPSWRCDPGTKTPGFSHCNCPWHRYCTSTSLPVSVALPACSTKR